MRMNTNIPMMATTPDVAGSLMSGMAARQQMLDWQSQNALRDFMQQRGGDVLSGDANALAGLAGLSPELAMKVQGQQHGMAMDERQFGLAQQQARHGMNIDNQRLALARQEGTRAAAEHAARMSALERQQSMEEVSRAGQAVAMAWKQGPRAYEQAMSRIGDALPDEMKGVPYEEAPYLLEFFAGVGDAFAGPEPMSPEGKLYADINAGMVPPDAARGDEFRPATPDELQRFGAAAGQIGPDGRFYPVNPPSGMSLRTTPDGGVEMVQGPGAGGKFTEAQSKDNVYATRARGALADVNMYEGALLSLPDTAAGAIPLGLGNYAQSEDFQVGQNAGTEFLQAILRKDTGTAITSQEQEEFGKTYLPKPGDKTATVQRKREARERAVQAIESGMSPEQILAQERALMGTKLTTASDGMDNRPIPPTPPQSFATNPQVKSLLDSGIDPQMLWDNLSDETKREFFGG